MGKTVRSAKGALVDFDLLKIKSQIASAPKPTVVQAREDFVDQRMKRKLKRLTQPMVDSDIADNQDPQDVDPDDTIDTPTDSTESTDNGKQPKRTASTRKVVPVPVPGQD